jgi:hypothetical protein
MTHTVCKLLVVLFVIGYFFCASLTEEERAAQWTLKQPIANLQNLSRNWYHAFAHEWAESGGVVFPKHKLVICSYPKAGTTTTKWIMLALLGLEKAVFCDKKHKSNVQFDHKQYTNRGALYLRDRYPINAKKQGDSRQGWHNTNYLGPSRRPGNINQTLDYNWRVAEFFLDPEWTTISFVRDPWWRAISMWHHQLYILKHLPKTMNYTSRADFKVFIDRYASGEFIGSWRHTGSAARFCGMGFIKYDLYINIDNIAEGLRRLIAKRPMFDPILNTGWESCTLTGKKSLLEDQSNQDHAMLEFGSTNHKLKEYDRLFCENETVDAVYNKYRSDYDFLGPAIGFHKHTTCIHERNDNSSIFPPPISPQPSYKASFGDLSPCRLCDPNYINPVSAMSSLDAPVLEQGADTISLIEERDSLLRAINTIEREIDMKITELLKFGVNVSSIFSE